MVPRIIGQVEAMKLLKSYGADENVQDGKGRTPAKLLAERNKLVDPEVYWYVEREERDAQESQRPSVLDSCVDRIA